MLIIPFAIQSQCPVPTIISPDGGEELKVGEEYEIQYLYNENTDFYGIVEYVYLYYTVDDGIDWIFIDTVTVDSTLAANGSILTYNWVIPTTISDNCLIKVSTYDTWCWRESEAVFTITPNVSINERILGGKIDLYPNPINQGRPITLNVYDSKFERIYLSDNMGRIIQELVQEATTVEVKTDRLVNGIYYLRLQNGKEVITKKIIIN